TFTFASSQECGFVNEEERVNQEGRWKGKVDEDSERRRFLGRNSLACLGFKLAKLIIGVKNKTFAPKMEDYFEVVVHHGGHFVNRKKLDYLGTWNISQVWRCGISLIKGLKASINDNGAMKIINITKVQGKLYLFILHLVSQPNIIDNVDNKLGMDEVGGSCKENGPVVDGSCKENKPSMGGFGKKNGFVVGVVVKASGTYVDKEEDSLEKEVVEVNVDGLERKMGMLSMELLSEDTDVEDNDSDYNLEHICFDDFDKEINENDLFEVYVSSVQHKNLNEDEFKTFVEVNQVEEETMIVAKNVKRSNSKQKTTITAKGKMKRGRPRKSTLPTPTLTPPFENLSVVSDNDSLFEESCDIRKRYREKGISNMMKTKVKVGKFPIFNMPKKMENYKWEVGTYFVDKEEFKEALLPMLCIQVEF
ncbi:hypothetical protein CR513_01001, partial [Mucuna pruriens]